MESTLDIKNSLYYEGDIDESLLVFFMKKINSINYCSSKCKSNLKIVLIELITNAITHFSGLPYGRLLIKKENNDCIIAVSNLVDEKGFKQLIENINHIKTLKNVKQEYNNLLAAASFDKLMGLGLLEIYNKSNGNLEISSVPAHEYKLITIKLKIDG